MKEKIKAKLLSLSKIQLAGVIAIGLVIAVGASAALLQVYVTLTGTAQVEQSVVLIDGTTQSTSATYTIGNSPAIAGNTYTKVYTLWNKSESIAPMQFNTSYNSDADASWRATEDGIETKYYGVTELSTKDPSTWEETDTMKATLTYELSAPSFNYELESTTLAPNTAYSLIYYADYAPGGAWGGDNPGALIATMTSDANGKVSISGSSDLIIDLPSGNDWNGTSGATGFCTEDSGLCQGAKVWLVPSADYNAGQKKLSAWTPANYLFETGLIIYNNQDPGVIVNMPKGRLDIYIKNVLAVNLVPQTYNVKTEIVPAQ